MDKKQLQKFIKWLQEKNYIVIGPIKEDGQILIKPINEPSQLDFSGQLPLYSFKKFLVPSREILFKYKKDDFKADLTAFKQALIGVSIFDLKAILLYNQVFEKDPYYQARLNNTLIIGQSQIPQFQSLSFKVWEDKYEEDILEHLQFDIFLGQAKEKKSSEFKIFTGSKKGQQILNDFTKQSGWKSDFEHIEYAGPIKEQGANPEMTKIKEKMPGSLETDIWQNLDQRCIECGKCTIVCPTCFCFSLADQPCLNKDEGMRKKCWDSCFYAEFSEITGGHKFLKNTAERIYNWYYHKFVRIPDEYNFPGCVGCGRCSMVCPAGIKIHEVLESIKNKK
ncbi:MAG: 4Fe-4S dicluster domain-containing protein [Patescibacteria group bacterium]|nr:4Fe-4S dicluster domain-containing protein [Patescibacteria group bacterium]MDD5164789.1 4Fe-4S dicluster domain-containing protein [Patescibacteria group bacterium]MDD5534789.1 4Fe-4S dicluster domain-containing protein [Patescibacteria group bacterium]